MEALKWMNFVAAIWLQVINGTNLDFSAYSSVLKEAMGVSQVELNNLAVASDLGKALGWLSGLASLYFPLYIVLLIGASLGFVGYGLQWLFLAHKIHSLAYWEVFILCTLAGNSVCWFNTASYVLCIRNFGRDKAFALGLSTSYVGLSPAFYTCLQGAISSDNNSIYLLLNALLPAIVFVLSVPFIGTRAEPESDSENENENTKCIVVTFYAMAMTTGAYLLLRDLVPSSSSSSQTLIELIVLLLFLLLPLFVPLGLFILYLKKPKPDSTKRSRSQRRRDSTVQVIDADEEMRMDRQLDQELGGESVIKKKCMVGVGEDHNIPQLLRSIDFLLFFMVYLCGGTLGLVFINNLGQIAESRGYSNASIFVSLSSSFGFFGRMASPIPDYFPRLPRPAWMGILMAPMAASFFLLVLTNNAVSLYIATAILGIFTGTITSIAISLTSELFGLKNFGVNHNILVINIPLGSLLFGYLAGMIYDKRDGQKNTISTTCRGIECYRDTFLIWGCVSVLGMVLSLILSMRTRKFYHTRI